MQALLRANIETISERRSGLAVQLKLTMKHRSKMIHGGVRPRLGEKGNPGLFYRKRLVCRTMRRDPNKNRPR